MNEYNYQNPIDTRIDKKIASLESKLKEAKKDYWKGIGSVVIGSVLPIPLLLGVPALLFYNSEDKITAIIASGIIAAITYYGVKDIYLATMRNSLHEIRCASERSMEYDLRLNNLKLDSRAFNDWVRDFAAPSDLDGSESKHSDTSAN